MKPIWENEKYGIRVFPRRTKWTPDDALSFIGYPGLFLPKAETVRVSVTFTWDIEEGIRLKNAWGLYYDNVTIGGPAFGDPGETFNPGEFVKSGIVFTSRGCIRNCDFCVVRGREGVIRELPITEGNIIQDNNILACSRSHIVAVFEMLKKQKRAAKFSGGLDARLLKPWHRDLFDTIKISELWFACDDEPGLRQLEKISPILDGIPVNKKRCYTLFGFNGDTPQKANERASKVLELGFLPFAQLYISPTEQIKYSPEFKQVARYWSRPAIYRSKKNVEIQREDCDVFGGQIQEAESDMFR